MIVPGQKKYPPNKPQKSYTKNMVINIPKD